MATKIEKLEYVIKHDPIRYILKEEWPYWVVENLDGTKVSYSFFKFRAQVDCDFFNAIYSLGYAYGIKTMTETLKNTDLTN